MTPKENILKLTDGQCWIWPESDYGKAEIWYKNSTYFLFEIPTFGGEPRFVEAFSIRMLDTLINIVEGWS